MAQVTNLNRFRKQKARDDKRKRGAENAARFGQSKAERDLTRARTDKAARDLDGHRTDNPDTRGDTDETGAEG